MSEREGEQDDPLADLQPEQRKSERTTQIIALAASIASARDRGNSWANICRRLEERRGISVSPDHLRMTMERYANYKPSTRKRIKPNTKQAKKPNTKTTAKANTEAVAQAGNRGQQQTNAVSTAEPTVGRSPETANNNNFLKMKEKL